MPYNKYNITQDDAYAALITNTQLTTHNTLMHILIQNTVIYIIALESYSSTLGMVCVIFQLWNLHFGRVSLLPPSNVQHSLSYSGSLEIRECSLLRNFLYPVVSHIYKYRLDGRYVGHKLNIYVA